jgi:hypothetical protein
MSAQWWLALALNEHAQVGWGRWWQLGPMTLLNFQIFQIAFKTAENKNREGTVPSFQRLLEIQNW